MAPTLRSEAVERNASPAPRTRCRRLAAADLPTAFASLDITS